MEVSTADGATQNDSPLSIHLKKYPGDPLSPKGCLSSSTYFKNIVLWILKFQTESPTERAL